MQIHPRIIGRSIHYPHHTVEIVGDFDEEFVQEYLTDMAAELSIEGTAEDHIHELNMLNNDGSWVVRVK